MLDALILAFCEPMPDPGLCTQEMDSVANVRMADGYSEEQLAAILEGMIDEFAEPSPPPPPPPPPPEPEEPLGPTGGHNWDSTPTGGYCHTTSRRAPVFTMTNVMDECVGTGRRNRPPSVSFVGGGHGGGGGGGGGGGQDNEPEDETLPPQCNAAIIEANIDEIKAEIATKWQNNTVEAGVITYILDGKYKATPAFTSNERKRISFEAYEAMLARGDLPKGAIVISAIHNHPWGRPEYANQNPYVKGPAAFDLGIARTLSLTDKRIGQRLNKDYGFEVSENLALVLIDPLGQVHFFDEDGNEIDNMRELCDQA